MSKVQFNLLPHSRAEYLQLQARQEELYTKVLKLGLICFSLFFITFIYANVIQKAQLSSQKKSIDSKANQLNNTPELAKVVTIENQLKTAANLNQQKHISSRLFGYLAKLTPSNASVNTAKIDFSANSIKIEGVANNATTVNAFIDALKFSQYQVAGGQKANAFSAVVEESFAINTTNVTYSLSANFDPNLFANNLTDSNGKATEPALSLPKADANRSDPGSLFGGSR